MAVEFNIGLADNTFWTTVNLAIYIYTINSRLLYRLLIVCVYIYTINSLLLIVWFLLSANVLQVGSNT